MGTPCVHSRYVTTNVLFSGFIIAFVVSWRVALVVSVIIPLIAITGGIMNKFLTKLKKQSLDFVADGGQIAEEVCWQLVSILF